jgi:predicted RNase H-like HicB family nuclease
MREFTVVIEQDEDGIYVASVPELPGCHTQAETLDELNRRIKEAIELYLEVETEKGKKSTLILSEYRKLKLRYNE